MRKKIPCQRAIERSHKLSTLSRRKDAGVTDEIRHVKKVKWQWDGHLMKKNDENWDKKLTEWIYPLGYENEPRQTKKMSGRDMVKKVGGTLWSRKTKDRR